MRIQTFSIIAGTAACNASCPYCISKMTPKQSVGLKEPNVNWRNFEKACRFAQMNSVTTILLTGKGEPTLYPNQITKFLKKMKRFNFPIIELQTNGLVLEKKESDKYLKEWYELGLTTIAISIVHYKKEKNKEIFCPDQNYPDLERLIKKLHKIGFTVRLSCTMIKGFIDSKEKAKEMIYIAKKWDVEQLSLREVAVPLKSDCKKVYDWTCKNTPTKEEYSEIRKFVIRNGNKILTLPHNSAIYDVDGQNVCITNALTIEPDTENLRQIIFFPDGHLRYDWQFRGATIF